MSDPKTLDDGATLAALDARESAPAEPKHTQGCITQTEPTYACDCGRVDEAIAHTRSAK